MPTLLSIDTTMVLLAFLCLTATAPLLASPPVQGSSSPVALTQQGSLSLKDAEAIALRAVPGGRVLSVERDTKMGRPVFEVEVLDQEGWEIELVIDASDGKILSQRRDD